MPSEEKLIDLRVQQLQMIQAIITRMAGYSASLKGFCLTVVAAIGGAAATLKDTKILAFAIVTIVIFAVLDARYLHLERRFIGLYNLVRSANWSSMPDFNISLDAAPQLDFWSVLISWSVIWFYLILFVGFTAAMIYAR